ncbi:MAG: aminoacyl-tRNA hydrolase [Clostridia bacterium]|nr:aminoacyl-tRNA hydrolase [Clostridia bacterium]
MFLIAGLGNPGDKYFATRHNAGFLALDYMAQKYDITVKSAKHKSLLGEGRIAGERVVLLKPQTFMNLSGEAVRSASDWYKIPVENIIVIYDDIDLEVGALRIRPKGSAGGHNGMKSIISHLGSQDFPRFRIGVGSKPQGGDLCNHVLGTIPKAEQEVMFKVFERTSDAVEEYIRNGIDSSMNKYNGKAE